MYAIRSYYEDLAHRRREPLVHGEALALPVAAGAEALELVDDLPARLAAPLPDPLDEGLAPQFVAVLPLGGKLLLSYNFV